AARTMFRRALPVSAIAVSARLLSCAVPAARRSLPEGERSSSRFSSRQNEKNPAEWAGFPLAIEKSALGGLLVRLLLGRLQGAAALRALLDDRLDPRHRLRLGDPL